MSKFLTALDQILLDEDGGDGRCIWRLDKPLVYQSDLMGEITVPSGFEHDSASVPRMPVVWWLAGDTAHAAAVVHDYLYACRGNLPDGRVYDRQQADRVFLEAMSCSEVPAWRARVMYWAVRIFGRW